MSPEEKIAAYQEFLAAKASIAPQSGLDCEPDEVHPVLKSHQRDSVVWGVRGGRRAWFLSFGLGKSLIQLESERLILSKLGSGRGLIVCPLGVRQEFARDAALIGVETTFIRSHAEATRDGIYLTNYESVREGKLDPRGFDVVSLDEAAILRGFGGTLTFRELMRIYEGSSAYRFVATATPSPNEYLELLSYAAFLDIMQVSEGKTRFFKRDSEHADRLTLHGHMQDEFWHWLASWGLFLSRPSDLGHDDTGYELPPLDIRWHEVESPMAPYFGEGQHKDGQGFMFRSLSLGVQDAAREKRESITVRAGKVMEAVRDAQAAGDGQIVIWADLNDEQKAIEKALAAEGITVSSLYGSQPVEDRERLLEQWRSRETTVFLSKPSMYGAGVNLQQAHRMIFAGITFKFSEVIQGIHRVHRFLQESPVTVDLIYTEAERGVRELLERKWGEHENLVARMGEIIRERGLARDALAAGMTRSIGVKRREVSGGGFTLANNDSVLEAVSMADSSVGLIVTSIPFSSQYQYSPAVEDFGYSEDNDRFWAQMDFLTPELFRVLAPGRIAAIHVKDRITPGGLSGLGFQALHPFHAEAIFHYRKHGFALMAMITVVTDVVRENNQTYRLGWTEQCKDGTKMGAGVPEYVLVFRKPPSDNSTSYADVPVVKSKRDYSRARWQVDAHGFWRSSGDRSLLPGEFDGIAHKDMFRKFRDHYLSAVYDYEEHVAIGEHLDNKGRLPSGFMLLQPPSAHPDVWTDVARMRTLNMEQERKGQQFHLCLARGSLVLTKGGYKPIQEVQVGELVLTHKGRWRPVLVVQNTGVRPVVTIRAHGVPGLTLTPGHKVWMRKGAAYKERYTAERAEPAWIPAAEAARGYVNLKLPPVEAASVADETYWWTVGRWLADGHIDKRGCAIISVGRAKWGDFSARIGRFGGNPPHEGTALQVALRDPGYELRRTLKDCGHGAAGKHLPPEAFTLPAEQARALLDGYLSGDGHLVPGRERWMATSVSRELLLGFAMLVQRAYGAIPSIYPGKPERTCVIEGRTVHANQEWILSFDLPGQRRGKPFILDDGAWKKVRAVDQAAEIETWNLRVAEDESYTAEGCIVKNCPLPWDIVDRLLVRYSNEGETVYDPFGGIMTVPYRAVRLGRHATASELNPRYFTDGVAYVRAAADEAATPTLFDLLDDAAPGAA